ncbi:MAG TPA: UbiA family prenyltransferase, partial [Terriglobales bacterium]|nr:UbiA family prenyltransferase [Terriglobales bacterium]
MNAAKRLSRAAEFVRARDWVVQWPVVLVTAGAYAGRAGSGLLARLVWVLVMESLLVAAGYMVNDVFDAATDVGKRRADVAQGYRARKLAAAALAITAGLAMAWALEPAKRWLVGAQIVLGLGYSAPGIRLKERGILGLAAAASLQRLPAFALAIEWPPRVPLLASALGAWLLALGLVFILEHQREDLDADRRARVVTWSVRAGRAAAARARAQALVALWLATALAVMARWGRPADVAAAALVPVATAVSIALIGRRYASNRRLPAHPASCVSRPVVVHGAGLSGLVAAIRLADWGIPVEVRERSLSPSGTTDGGQQVHSMLQDPARIAAHLGLSIESSFERTEREVAYVFGRRLTPASRHWNCSRGSAPGSLDAELLAAARARGVVLRFERPWRQPGRTESCEILATGHGPAEFEALRLPSEPLDGWCAEASWDGPPFLLTYRDHWSGSGFG